MEKGGEEQAPRKGEEGNESGRGRGGVEAGVRSAPCTRGSSVQQGLTLTMALRKPAMREKRPVRARPIAVGE